MSLSKYIKHEYAEIGFLIGYVVLVAIVLPILGLFYFGASSESVVGSGGFAGLNEYFAKVFFYIGPFLIPAILILVGFKLLQVAKIPHFISIIHDPQQGFFKKIKLFKFFDSPFKTAIVFLMLFLPLGILFLVTNTFLGNVPPEQQLTPTANLIFALEPAVSSETLFTIALIVLAWSGLNWLAVKLKVNKDVAKIMIPFLVIILGTLFYGGVHTARYGASEKDIANVLIMGLLGSILTVSVGSVIPWMLLHYVNNFFAKSREVFASDTTVIVLTIAFMTLLIISYFLITSKVTRRSIIKAG